MVPAAAALETGRAAEVPYERIDTHNHIHRSAPGLVAIMEKAGWRGLSICDSREIGDQKSVLPEMIPGTARFHRESKGRWAWATTFDARGFDQPGFAERAIAGLQQGFDQEAIAVKIWKNIGMGIRGKSGEYLLPDNPLCCRSTRPSRRPARLSSAILPSPTARGSPWAPTMAKPGT